MEQGGEYLGHNNKQLLDQDFVICRIINFEVRVISRAESEANNFYWDIKNFAYHKNRIQCLFYYTFQAEKTTKSNNWLTKDFRSTMINMARNKK